jgi:hypothetical protein
VDYLSLLAGFGLPLALIAAVFLFGFVAPRERARAARVAAKAKPERREPRDLSRPYPRPKGHRSKLNRVCPVCGTGRETTTLDVRLLGWPAHRTCTEWLGGWKPSGRIDDGPAMPYRLGLPSAPAGPWFWWCRCGASGNGMATIQTVDEALRREHTAHQESCPYATPAPPRSARNGSAACACGTLFVGSPPDLVRMLDRHKSAAECAFAAGNDPGPIPVEKLLAGGFVTREEARAMLPSYPFGRSGG